MAGAIAPRQLSLIRQSVGVCSIIRTNQTRGLGKQSRNKGGAIQRHIPGAVLEYIACGAGTPIGSITVGGPTAPDTAKFTGKSLVGGGIGNLQIFPHLYTPHAFIEEIGNTVASFRNVVLIIHKMVRKCVIKGEHHNRNDWMLVGMIHIPRIMIASLNKHPRQTVCIKDGIVLRVLAGSRKSVINIRVAKRVRERCAWIRQGSPAAEMIHTAQGHVRDIAAVIVPDAKGA